MYINTIKRDIVYIYYATFYASPLTDWMIQITNKSARVSLGDTRYMYDNIVTFTWLCDCL